MKKLIALSLSLIMLFGFIFPASASQTQTETQLSDSAATYIVDHVVRNLVGSDETDTIRYEHDMDEMMDTDNDDTVSLDEITSFFAEYTLLDLRSWNNIAQEIANNSEYKVNVLSNGETVVYVFVDIERYPQLFIPSIFAKAVELIHEAQREIGIATGEHFNEMSSDYIAGELFLHKLIYGATFILGGAFDWNPLHEYYEGAREACLNADEDRLPSWMFEFIGSVLNLFTRFTKFFSFFSAD